MNQENRHFYFPEPSRETKNMQEKLHLDSNCQCSPCQSKKETGKSDVEYDRDLDLLKSKDSKKGETRPDLVIFL